MDRGIKYSIIASLLVVSLSVSYYLVIFLPQKEQRYVNEQEKQISKQAEQQEKEDLLNQQESLERCRVAGERAYRADQVQYGNELFDNPKYGYNKKLNVCLYSGGFMHDNPNNPQCGDLLKHDCKGYWQRWVKNSHTNEFIISIYNFADQKTETGWSLPTEEIEKFWQQEGALFSE